MGLKDEFMDALEMGISAAGSINAFAAATGINASTMSRWRSGQRVPTLSEGEKMCAYLRLHLVTEDVLRDMSQAEDFVSVPIVDPYKELHPGFIPESQITGWCKIDRRYSSVKGKSDLVVVQVMDDSSRTIKDGSLVLIDRSDREIVSHMLYLVCQYGVMGIRRVYVADEGKVIWRNLRDGTPTVFTIEEAEKAIVGRAGWIRGSIEDGRQLILDGR